VGVRRLAGAGAQHRIRAAFALIEKEGKIVGTYVLVHGAWMDARAWEKVTPLLENAGHRVIAPDLPGHGADTTPVRDIALDGYTDAIARIVRAQEEPVILVGHSMAGTVISQVAERQPERIATLVYLSAYLLQNGESLFQIATADGDSQLGPALVPDETNGVLGVRADALPGVFFNGCSEADTARYAALAKPEPLAPLATPVAVTAERYGRVPRVYIATARDRVISPAAQERMVAASPCRAVHTLDAGHASFLSHPAPLAGLLRGL
jgi:pimeloyl-ACP methyl ester carboxylesterase